MIEVFVSLNQQINSIVWSIADILNGLMALPNLIALLSLGGVVFGLTKKFLRDERYKIQASF